MHDALTGLPNRKLFAQRSRTPLAEAVRDGTGWRVFLLDLDRFKEVNDTLGHHAGDQLLEVVGRAGSPSAVRPDDTVARLGGDEFAVLLPDVGDADRRDRGRRRGSAPRSPSRSGSRACSSRSRRVDRHRARPEPRRRRRAAAAARRRRDVRRQGASSTGVEVYDAAARPATRRTRLGTVGALRRRIDARRARAALPAQGRPRRTGSRRRRGAGALAAPRARAGLRRTSSSRSPSSTGLDAPPITRYVLDAALAQVADWWAGGLRRTGGRQRVACATCRTPTSPTVAAGARPARPAPGGAGARGHRERARAGPRSGRGDPARAGRARRALSLDDFGTGYSSLLLLERLPVGS